VDRERSRATGPARLTARGGRNDSEGSTRRVLLSGQTVEYRLFRAARRRSIGMLINHSGLIVRAPRWVPLREIELALVERADWIVETLVVWRGRNVESLPTEWRSGASLLYQGRALALALFPARSKTIDVDLLHLVVRHPSPADESQIAAYVGHWLRQQALAWLAPRVAHFAGHVRASPPALKLSNARTQWGSCNHRGEIRLSWRLIQLPPRLADYVVAHEVAHLVELNHSPRFWALVEAMLPGHDEARRQLDDMTPIMAD
jgi:predicted metal-dependent hydrolase